MEKRAKDYRGTYQFPTRPLACAIALGYDDGIEIKGNSLGY